MILLTAENNGLILAITIALFAWAVMIYRMIQENIIKVPSIGSRYRRDKYELTKVNNDGGFWIYLYDGQNTVPIKCDSEVYRTFSKLLQEMPNVNIIMDVKVDTSDFRLVRIYGTTASKKTHTISGGN